MARPSCATAAAGASDEFDRWLTEEPPKGAEVAAPTTEPQKTGGTWFSASSLLSMDPSAAPSLFSGAAAPSLFSGAAGAAASNLLNGTSGNLLSGVAGRVRASIQESVSAFHREAELYCSEEAQAKEQAELRQAVSKAALTEPPPPSHDAPWLEAPPHLRGPLEEAVRRLSSSEGTFLEATELLDESDRVEHAVLVGCARAALAFDEELVTRRFALVPGRMSEATFWANYFARVLRERRLFKLPPLRPEPPRAGDTSPACEGAAATAVSARTGVTASTRVPPSGAGAVAGGAVAASA